MASIIDCTYWVGLQPIPLPFVCECVVRWLGALVVVCWCGALVVALGVWCVGVGTVQISERIAPGIIMSVADWNDGL
eukprot:NODE_1406_length_972_cov_85.206934_g1084_i0.p1 GENE.NODE_1406_length_972_cov_85.206934_g1084_i0~~NODE_1406_length_972_cov_85.206934_g1084_i0.p1  ORF type:complete len:77 (+),score=22.72 NODE_1406_length_972_cov_85.206934_g1084_i0:105-335(+)